MRWLHARGSATAETAVVLPVLVLLLCAGLWALACVSVQIRCVDIARGAARAAARGEAMPAVLEHARAAAPAQAVVSASQTGAEVRVQVSIPVRPLGRLSELVPAITVSGAAISVREDTTPDIAPGIRP